MSKNKKPEKQTDGLTFKEKFDLTQKQQETLALGLHRDTRCLILDGPAGSAKTYLATLIALKLICERKSHGITYIRTSIQAKDGAIGFIPGTMEEKTSWMNEPLFSKLEELLIKPDVEKLYKEGQIQTLPSAFLRGLNIKNTTILDECQNAMFPTIETTLQRMAEHSLVILCGDSSGSQNDLGNKSGFLKTIDIFNDEESREHGIHYVKFISQDIVRSKFVKFVVEKISKNTSAPFQFQV